jgi:hypothetical protein
LAIPVRRSGFEQNGDISPPAVLANVASTSFSNQKAGALVPGFDASFS